MCYHRTGPMSVSFESIKDSLEPAIRQVFEKFLGRGHAEIEAAGIEMPRPLEAHPPLEPSQFLQEASNAVSQLNGRRICQVREMEKIFNFRDPWETPPEEVN